MCFENGSISTDLLADSQHTETAFENPYISIMNKKFGYVDYLICIVDLSAGKS